MSRRTIPLTPGTDLEVTRSPAKGTPTAITCILRSKTTDNLDRLLELARHNHESAPIIALAEGMPCTKDPESFMNPNTKELEVTLMGARTEGMLPTAMLI
jgi:hypothetical protein